MVNMVLNSLSIQHRMDQLRVANLSSIEMNAALNYASTLSDADWAKFIRSTMASLVTSYAPLAATMAADHYNTSRNLWAAVYGVKKVKSFAADSSLVMVKQEEIIETRRSEVNFFIDRVYKGEITRAQIAEPFKQATTAAIQDHDRQEQLILAEEDDFATGPRRIVRKQGCPFCQYLALASYGAGEGSDDGGKFHKGCSCSVSVAFDGTDEDPYWQDWMFDAQDEFDAARQSLLEQRVDIDYDGRERKQRPKELAVNTKNLIREVRAARSGKTESKAAERVERLNKA